MDIRKINIKQLNAAAYNPRKNLKKGDAQYEALKKSITEFDYIDPIVWNEQTGHVVGGHQRLKVLKELGYKEIDVSVVNMKLEKEKALNIGLNKIGGEFDQDKLNDLMGELSALKFDMDLTGFNEEEIMSMLDVPQEEKTGLLEDDFNVEDHIPEVPVSVYGDVYQLGEHRLMCGDSTNEDDVAILMDGHLADMVFTDPPYGVNYQSNMRTRSEKFDVLKNDNVILDFLPNIEKFSSGFVFLCTAWKVLDIWLDLFGKYFDLTNMIIWNKGGGGIGDLKKTFSTDYEVILTSHRGNEIKGKRIGSVWSIGKDSANDYVHPTQKPVALAALAIEETTEQGDIVLDFFGGSGSTLIAAEQKERKARLMELDPRYVDVIIKRWETFTGQKAIKVR